MFSHGIVTGALFLLVGMLQDRTQTREAGELGGLLQRLPLLGWSFVLAAFASLGLPGLAHFPAELQIFLATLRAEPAGVVVVIGIAVIAGVYLNALRRCFLGELPERWRTLPDLGVREKLAIAPLLVLIIALGLLPSWVIEVIHRTTAALAR